MKISLPLFICLLHGIVCVENSSHLTKYLDDREKSVGEKLIRRARNEENDYDVKFNEVNNMKLIGNYSKGEIFTFFNTPYALLGQELYKISRNNYSKLHEFPKSENINLLKVAQLKNLGFVAFTTNTSSLHIFGFSNKTQKVFKIQNIVHVNITDAVFFKHEMDLYLAVSSYYTADITSVIIYKFVTTHFDETNKFVTSSATKLHTFDNNGSTIIIILKKYGPTSSVHEFKSGQIKKIQKFDALRPEHVVSYQYRGKKFVIIFHENQADCYLWTGSELLLREKVTTVSALSGKIVVIYDNDIPYLLSSSNTNLLIFSLINNKFLLMRNETDVWTYDYLNSTNMLVTLKPAADGTLEITTASVSIHVKLPSQNIVEEERLLSCYLSLEKAVYSLRSKIRSKQNETDSNLREATGDRNLNHLRAKLETVKATRSKDTLENLVFNTTLLIDVPIRAKKVTAKDIRLEEINKQKWQPERWLSYTVPQKISGPVKAKKVEVENLETSNEVPLFNNLLLSKGNQILTGSLKVKNLKSDALETKFLNKIPVENFHYEGKKFGPYLRVDNLNVETVNGINFEKFKDSVFRIGQTDAIDGNLIFTTLEVKSATFDTISKMSSVLTTRTNQTINSSITISKIFTKNINANTINGIDFKNSVATFNNSVIEGPVTIKKLNVRNNLELKGNISREFLQFNDTHIVGTNESDFMQRYNGRVSLNGNLILKNLGLGKLAKMFVSDKEFDPKMDQFWTKSTPQEIPTHFEAQNGISTPHLFANFINDVIVSDYMLNSTQQKKHAKFYFDNVTIKGNVLLNPNEQHSPDLQRIQRESVKINGVFRIKGRKTYGDLKVDALEVNHLEGENVPEKLNGDVFSGLKKIQNLHVRGNLTAKNLSTRVINGVNLQELVETTVYIDRSQNVSELNFENITVKNLLVTSKLNQFYMKDLISKFRNIDNVTKISDVYVDNVTIKNVQNLATINGEDIAQLTDRSPLKSDNRTVSGIINFTGNVTVKNLYVLTVNDIDLEKLSQRLLYKSWDQIIKEHFIFTKLTSANLITDQINDYHIQNLIDISSLDPQEISAPNGLSFSDNVKIQNLRGSFQCDISESLKNLRSPPSQFWNRIVVTGNVTFWDKESLVSRILEQTVTRQDSNRVIKGKVKFMNHLSANTATIKKTVNNIDLMEIVEDAFLNRADIEQVVTGNKTFSQFEAEKLVSLQNVDVDTVNGYKISEIDSKIISKNAILDVPVKGQKVFFGGLQTEKIEIESILGVEPENLVSFENTERMIPRAIFDSVTVTDNFNIEFVNGMPFEVLLRERLLKKAPTQTMTGNYFFRNVKFVGNISTPKINDIEIENLIYDEGVQTIESPKKFINGLKVVGDIKTEYVNGLKLSEAYEKAVLKNEDTNFTGSLTFMKPSLMEGNIQTKHINNFPVDYMFDTSANYSLQTETQQIQEIVKLISSFIHKYLNATIRMPTELLYLERSTNLQISLPNTMAVQVSETKDDVLIHIESEENGEFCGLPDICKCPVQQTMRVSSENSVNIFINKAMQRIYTYYDDSVTVHFITHSVSTNSHCRTSQTKVLNEVSSLAWNTAPEGNNTGHFAVHRAFFTGYVSGVKFFTIFGTTYIVVGIYYDPVLDTHSVNSLVLRLNEDKTAVEEIQQIPTEGVKTMSLIPTAQGVVLILGNEKLNETTTKIYRFSQERQQFELLREVPAFKTLFAEGVVLETDSLITLANDQSTLHILKYQAEFDNYYFYQSFQMDYPVSSLSVFYAGGFGISDAYLTVVTANERYFIYSFQFIEGWKLEFSGALEGVKSLVPFKLNHESYLFPPSSNVSSLLTLVEHDSH